MNKTLFSCLLLVSILSACQNKQKADLIVIANTVYSVDQQFNTQQAFAVKDGLYLAIGSKEEINAAYQADNTLNLDNAYVYPGLYDAHCHFYGLGQKLKAADLVGTTSFDDVLAKVKTFADANPQLAWIKGRGWDQNDWENKAFPTKTRLDELFPDKPVFLTRVDGHAALVNQKALDLAQVTANTPISGGKVIVENGQVTGLLIDNAVDLINKVIPKPTDEEMTSILLAAQEACISKGLTSLVDAGLPKKVIDKIDQMQKNGQLKIRINAMIDPIDKDYYLANGFIKTDLLSVRSFKIYADGALGSRGACLLHPYSDDLGNSGFLLSSPEELEELMAQAHAKGFQVNTHCIGDSANRLTLDIYGKLLGENNDARWRIEHAQVIHPDDMAKFKKYKVIPSVQPTHCTSDMYWAGDRLGKDRVSTAYAFKQLMEQNDVIAFGSDFPVEAVNPLFGFHSAVARQDAKAYPEGGFQMENAIDRQNSLKAMTSWAAYSCFQEKETGSIEVGKKADFVVLEKDLMKAPANELRDVKVISTFIGGKQVFGK